MAGQLKLLGGVCDGVPSSSSSQEQPLPKLQAINLETGWPSRGIANGLAVPGVLEQRVAVRGIVEGSGGRSVLLGYGDEGWREGGQFGVEGSWGCGGIFGEGEGEGVLGG